MWVIHIFCISLQCDPASEVHGAFATKAACDKAIISVYRNWRAVKGDHVFNCVYVSSGVGRI